MKKHFIQLLRWSERYTKTDMVYFTGNGFWLTAGNILVAVAGLCIAYIFANFLPPALYGEYKYVLAVLGMLSLMALPEVNIAYSHAVARGNEGGIFQILKTKASWSLFGSLAALMLGGYYVMQGNDTFAFYFVFVSLILPFYDTFNTFHSFLNGKKLFKTSSIYKIIIQLIVTGVTIYVAYTSNNIALLLAAVLLTHTVLHILFYYYTIYTQRPNTQTEQDIISYGKKLWAINLIGNVSSNLDTFILWHFLGPQQLAIYLFAKLPIDQMRTLLKFTTPLAVPKLVGKSNEELKKILPGKIIRFTFFITVVVVLYILLVPYLFAFMFPVYSDSVFYSQLAALTLLFFPKKLFGISIAVQKQKRMQLYVQAITAASKIILLCILVPLFQILGAVLALITGHIVTYIVLIVLIYRNPKQT